jgi:hypothetical protein
VESIKIIGQDSWQSFKPGILQTQEQNVAAAECQVSATFHSGTKHNQ